MAQDGALSRLKPEFESPWGHRGVTRNGGSFFIQAGVPIEGMIFESPCPHQGAAQGASVFLKPPTHAVEWFLFLLRFDSREK